MTIYFDPIKLPLNANYTHSNTSWEFYTSHELIPENLINSFPMSTEFLESVTWNYNLNKNEVIYVRSKIHYSNGTSDKWSRPLAMREGMKGFKLSNTIIVTPTVSVLNGERNIEEEFTITTSDYYLYAGKGEHSSTSYYVQDTAGNNIWKREKVKAPNLTEIKVKGCKLNPNQSYVVIAQHHNDMNTDSNYGKVVIATNITNPKYGQVDNSNLYVDRINYYGVDISNPSFINYTVRLINENDVVIFELTTDKDNFKIPTLTTIEKDKEYRLKITQQLNNSKVLETETKLLTKSPQYFDCKYRTGGLKMLLNDIEEGLDTHLNLDVSSMELPTGEILMLKGNELTPSIFRYIDNELVYEGIADITLTGIDLTRPVRFKLINETTLVISTVVDDGGVKRPKFWIYDYNPYTGELTYRLQVYRNLETILGENLTSFISHTEDLILYTSKQGSETYLSSLNYYTGVVTILTPLAVDITKSLSLAGLCDDFVLVVGIDNTSIYDINNNLIQSIGSFPTGMLKPDTEYRLEKLETGEILLFAIDIDSNAVVMKWQREESIWSNPMKINQLEYVPSLIVRGGEIILIDFKEVTPVTVRVLR